MAFPKALSKRDRGEAPPIPESGSVAADVHLPQSRNESVIQAGRALMVRNMSDEAYNLSCASKVNPLLDSCDDFVDAQEPVGMLETRRSFGQLRSSEANTTAVGPSKV
jgi:hypothetical protein